MKTAKKKTAKKPKMELDEYTLETIRLTAGLRAMVAHEQCFHDRDGIWIGKGSPSDGLPETLCLYNNHPYDRRDAETARFRAWLRKQGILELAYETYPPAGQQDAGYTYAMTIAAGEDRVRDVNDELLRIRAQSLNFPDATS